jgi:hypothetical protein
MNLFRTISRTHASDATPSISVYDVIANWDWRIVRLAFVALFVWAGIVQILWARESHLQSITFFYTMGAAASAVCSLLYWQLVRFRAEESNAEQHRYRLYVQIAGGAVWFWTAGIDVYVHVNEVIFINPTSWLHHLLINITILALLFCLCLNEIAAITRAEKSNQAGGYE